MRLELCATQFLLFAVKLKPQKGIKFPKSSSDLSLLDLCIAEEIEENSRIC